MNKEERDYIRFCRDFEIPLSFQSRDDVIAYLHSLTDRQRRIIREITDGFSVVRNPNFRPGAEEARALWGEWARTIRKAVRARLENDPIVCHVLACQRVLGQTEFFRSFKRDRPDLARGVNRPPAPLTEIERGIVRDVVKLKKRGHNLKEIHQEIVIRQQRHEGSYEAFRRWLKRHGVSFSG